MQQGIVGVALGLAFLVWILINQVRPRPVKERTVAMWILAAVGLWQVVSYAGDHNIVARDWLILGGSLLIGAALAAVRAWWGTRIWDQDGVAMRRGNWVTVALWIVALGQHLASDRFLHAPDLGQVSLLFYISLMLVVQRELVLLRAQRQGLAPLPRKPVSL